MIAGIVANQIKKITASFNSNGGSPTYSSQIGYGFNLNVTNPGTPSRSGYTFNGWSPTVPRTITVDTSFVAQWTSSTPTLRPTIYFTGKGTSGFYITISYYMRNDDPSTATIYSNIDSTPNTSRGSIPASSFTSTVTENVVDIGVGGWTIYARAQASGKSMSDNRSLFVAE